jgi:cytochrome c peroxidase
MYLERQPNFSIGPDNAEDENVTFKQAATRGKAAVRNQKTAQSTARSANNLVPQGGLFWDGRADTLQDQSLAPLLNPLEMDGGSVTRIAGKLRLAPYASTFAQLFGRPIFENPRFLVSEAMFAVGRYQLEDLSFHPYSSKFDSWLEGKARLTPAELRGFRLFNDPHGGNCAACHVDRPSADGLPPLFTDHQFEALGVPRNMALAVNRNGRYFDVGICGPERTDMRARRQYCGMFETPTLRNVATRRVFFHNGVYHSLRQVLDFYNFRATEPHKVYPRRPDGTLEIFDDVPARYRSNVDVTDSPFDRVRGEEPPMTSQDERDIVDFLRTLTDGYERRR